MSIELEQQIASMKDQLATMGSMHGQLSNELPKLKQQISELTSTRDALLADVENMKSEIAARNNEREQELNKQSEIIKIQVHENTIEATRLFNLRTDLEEKQKAVEMRIEHAQIIEKDNNARHAELNLREVAIKEKEVELEKRLDEVAAKAVHLEEVTKNANDEILNHRNKGVVLDEKIKSCQAAEDRAIAMAEEMAQKAAALEKALNETKAKSQENTDLAAALDQKQKELDALQESQTRTFDQEKKRIEVAWGEIRNAIEKKNLDLKLEELKK